MNEIDSNMTTLIDPNSVFNGFFSTSDAKSMLPYLFSELEKYNGENDVFVHFSDVPKIGINPKQKYTTPLGIYFFPISYVLENNNIRNNSVFLEKPFVFVVRLLTDNILDLGKLNTEDILEMVEKVPEAKQKLKERIKDYAMDDDDLNLTPSDLMRVIEDLDYKKMYLSSFKFFKSLGYDGIIDSGTGALFGDSEPNQLVLFDIKSFEVIERIENETYSFNKKPDQRKQYYDINRLIEKRKYEIAMMSANIIFDNGTDGIKSLNKIKRSNESKYFETTGYYNGYPIIVTTNINSFSNNLSNNMWVTLTTSFLPYDNLEQSSYISKEFSVSMSDEESISDVVNDISSNIKDELSKIQLRKPNKDILIKIGDVAKRLGINGTETLNEFNESYSIIKKININKFYTPNGSIYFSSKCNKYGNYYNIVINLTVFDRKNFGHRLYSSIEISKEEMENNLNEVSETSILKCIEKLKYDLEKHYKEYDGLYNGFKKILEIFS